MTPVGPIRAGQSPDCDRLRSPIAFIEFVVRPPDSRRGNGREQPVDGRIAVDRVHSASVSVPISAGRFCERISQALGRRAPPLSLPCRHAGALRRRRRRRGRRGRTRSAAIPDRRSAAERAATPASTNRRPAGGASRSVGAHAEVVKDLAADQRGWDREPRGGGRQHPVHMRGNANRSRPAETRRTGYAVLCVPDCAGGIGYGEAQLAIRKAENHVMTLRMLRSAFRESECSSTAPRQFT